MARQTAWVLALALTCASSLVFGAPGSGQPPEPGKFQGRGDRKDPSQPGRPGSDRWKWWLYDRAELGITDQQSKDINDIFESTIPKLRETRQEMDRAEQELSRTIQEHKADVGTISLLIDRVESARSHYTKTRVLMLYRIDMLLSAEQRVKLAALRARNEAARRDRDKDSQPGRRRHP